MSEEEIIKQRMPVWNALSELYLYSNIEDSDCILEDIVRVCEKSDYSLAMLEKIYAYEVIPALSKNLAGCGWEADTYWAGFDPKWLCEKIFSYTNGKLIDEESQLSSWKKLSSHFRTLSTKKNWQAVKLKLEKHQESH